MTKPLETILRKSLSSAPKQLQYIMMKLNRYDIEFKILKGEKLVIADTLSRAYVKVTDPAEKHIFSEDKSRSTKFKTEITSTPACSISVHEATVQKRVQVYI